MTTSQAGPGPVATGVGSMPGTDVAEAVAIVAGELPDLPALPELPARGPGAELVGRTAALLGAVSTDFALTTVPSGWALDGRSGPDLRRAQSWLGEDLDRAEERFADSTGWFKVSLCGPFTWAAVVEDRSGRRLLRDAGFRRELLEGLTAAALRHVADVRRRLSGRQVVVQIDEPGLPAVLNGAIPTASGFSRLAAIPAGEVSGSLRRLVAALDVPVWLHCCADFPFAVARDAGVAGVSWDARGTDASADEVAATAESGIALIAGLIPATEIPATERQPAVDNAMSAFGDLWSRTGLGPAAARQVSVSPTCGLAGGTAASARAALAAANQLRRRLSEVE